MFCSIISITNNNLTWRYFRSAASISCMNTFSIYHIHIYLSIAYKCVQLFRGFAMTFRGYVMASNSVDKHSKVHMLFFFLISLLTTFSILLWAYSTRLGSVRLDSNRAWSGLKHYLRCEQSFSPRA